MVAWMRWINGMTLARTGNKGHLSMEGNYAQVQVQRGAQNPNQRTKMRKTEERKSCENQGVTNLPPLEKISSSRFGCSGNHRKLTILRKLVASRTSSYCILFPRWHPIYLRGFTSPGPQFWQKVLYWYVTSFPAEFHPHILWLDWQLDVLSFAECCRYPYYFWGISGFIRGTIRNPLCWILWDKLGPHG